MKEVLTKMKIKDGQKYIEKDKDSSRLSMCRQKTRTKIEIKLRREPQRKK
jgi:ribosomal protein L24E